MRVTWQPASLSLSVKFYFRNPPNLIAALHSTNDVAVSYILIRLRRQVSRHSESVCTTVQTSLHSSLPHKQGSWPISTLRISIVTPYVAIAFRGPSLHQHLCRPYLPFTASSEQTSPHHYRGRSHRYLAIAFRRPPIPTFHVVINILYTCSSVVKLLHTTPSISTSSSPANFTSTLSSTLAPPSSDHQLYTLHYIIRYRLLSLPPSSSYHVTGQNGLTIHGRSLYLHHFNVHLYTSSTTKRGGRPPNYTATLPRYG